MKDDHSSPGCFLQSVDAAWFASDDVFGYVMDNADLFKGAYSVSVNFPVVPRSGVEDCRPEVWVQGDGGDLKAPPDAKLVAEFDSIGCYFNEYDLTINGCLFRFMIGEKVNDE